MTVASSAERPPLARLFELSIVERVRDHAEERYAATGELQWSVLVEVMESFIAGEHDESELAAWVDQYDLWSALDMEAPR